MPKISIVLPNYNYARYLHERIQSLLGQTFSDFELIITDDASTDSSRAIIEKFAAQDERIRAVFYETNSGRPYQRWNDGAALATGEYLLFAGADDTCEPALLEMLIAPLEENRKLAMSYCQSWDIDSDGKKRGTWARHTDDLDTVRWQSDYVATGEEEIQYFLHRNIIPNSSAVLLRKEAFVAAGGFDAGLILAADWMLWIELLRQGGVSYHSAPLNSFRSHTGSVRQSTLRDGVRIQETYLVLQHIFRNWKIAEQACQRALNDAAKEWLQAYFRKGSGEVRRRSRAIAEIARRVDHHLHSRLARVGLRLALKELLVRLGLLDRAAKVVRPQTLGSVVRRQS